MKAVRRGVSACLLAGFLATWAAGQSTGVVLTGPSWMDVTAPPYRAVCDGSADDTTAIQNALNAVAGNPPAGGTVYIPATASGCKVEGAEFQISSIFSTLLSAPTTFTVTVISMDSGPPTNNNFPTNTQVTTQVNVPLVNIHNVPNGSNGTVFSGTYQIALVGQFDSVSNTCKSSGATGNFCITYLVQASTADSETPANAAAEIGLYYTGNNLRVLGAAYGSGTPPTPTSLLPTGSVLVTDNAITILTTMSPLTTNNAATGPDIENMTFLDKAANAYAGLEVGTSNGFYVANNGFSGFKGTGSLVSHDLQGGAGIVTNGGQSTCAMCTATPWVEWGKFENNHINATQIGFTSKFKISSVTFDTNEVNCYPSSGTPQQGQIGLDIGGLWYLNYFVSGGPPFFSTGGENRVINQQNQGCLIGTILGAQGNDRVEQKLENSPSGTACTGSGTPHCSIGMALLATTNSTLLNQTKSAASGIYIDQQSSNNTIYENSNQAYGSGASGDTLNTLCRATCGNGMPSTYSFNAASLMIDPAGATIAAGTLVFGTPSSGTFAPTSNSTFLNDYDPFLNSGGIATAQTMSTYPATLTDQYIICGTAPMTVTLPTTGQVQGKAYKIKNMTTGTCTVNAGGTVMIDNVTSFQLSRYQAIEVVWNGSQYLIFWLCAGICEEM